MNRNLLRLHNLAIVQSRKGWTTADAMKAVADGGKGIVYEPELFAKIETANAVALDSVPPYELPKEAIPRVS